VAKIKILDVIRAPSAVPERWGKEDVYISYLDERGVMRSIAIPVEEALTPEGKLNMEKVKEKIRATEAWRAEYIGMEVEL